jgi:hypothetical protein
MPVGGSRSRSGSPGRIDDMPPRKAEGSRADGPDSCDIVRGILAPRRFSLTARLVAVVLAVAALAAAGPSFAQAPPSVADKETARTLMNAGDDRYEAKDFPGALKAYQGADTIMHLPMTGIAVARAQAALGLLLEARDTALQVAHQPPQPGENAKFAEARAEAQTLADSVAARLPSLDLRPSASPEGLIVSIDDVALPPAALVLPRKVNPGKHVVSARAPGFADARVEITVAERATLPVPLRVIAGTSTLPPASTALTTSPAGNPPPIPPVAVAPPAPARSLSPLVYVGFGVGGASLIVGAITGGLSLARTSKLGDECPTDKTCPSNGKGPADIAAATTLANVSNVTFALGAAGVVTGIVGLVLSRGDRHPKAAAAIQPVVGPGTLGVVGVF